MNCTKYLSLASFLITSSIGLHISASRADQGSNAGFENAVVTQVSLDPFYQTAPAVPFAYGLKLTSVILRKTGWTEAEVIDRTQLMATALAQCGVKLTGLRIITADPPQGIVRFDGQLKREPEQLDDPNKKEALVTRLWPEHDRPTLFYVQSIANDAAYANLAEAELPEFQSSPVVDTIWISRATLSAEHKYSPNYSVEAHELGHVLGKLQHIYLPKLPGEMKNLMAADLYKTSGELNAKQCEKIRSSSLLHAL